MTNVDRARRWFEDVWNARRCDVVRELAPHCVGHHEDRVTNSPEEWLELHAQSLAAFPDLRVEIEDTVSEGDQVVVRWRMRGRHTGPFGDIAPTNRPVDVRGTTWMRFADGRIVEGWDSWNQGGLLDYLRGEVPAGR